MIKKNQVLILLVIIIAFFLRFYQLSQVPAGFFFDEATVGVNSYYLSRNLHDEFGNFLPDFIKIGDDYRHVAIFYVTAPFIKLFGLNEFAVRSATALFGILILVGTYLLTKKLFKSRSLAFLSLLLTSISPWLINLSRSSNEVILALFFLIVSDLFLIRGFEKGDKKYFIFAYLFIVLTWFSYSGAILISILHLLFFSTIALFSKRSKLIKISMALVFICFLIFPNLFYWISQPQKISGRFNQVSIFTEKGTQLVLNEQIREDGSKGPTSIFVTRIFHNKLINFSSVFFNNYLGYFSPQFLFGSLSLPIRYRIPNFSIIYLIDLPFLLFGLFTMFKKLTWQKSFAIFWLLSGPVAAAFTLEDNPDIQRAIFMIPAWQIITAYGIYNFFNLKNPLFNAFRLIKIFFIVVVAAGYTFSLGFFMHQLFVHQPLHQNWFRNSEWKEAALFISKLEKGYNHVVMAKSGTEPHYYLMFYSKDYRNQFQDDQKDYLANRNLKGDWTLGKYYFSGRKDCILPLPKNIQLNTLYINGQNCPIPSWVRVLGEAKTSDGVVKLTFLDVPLSEDQLKLLIRQEEEKEMLLKSQKE